MQGHLSAWLVKHGIIHRSLGFYYQGIETFQIKSEDWHSSVYHLTRIEYGVDQPEEVCIKVFASRRKFRILSAFWFCKSVDFQELESYDMLGISYDNPPPLKRIASLIGWPLCKDYIAPNFYEIQDAH